MGFSKTGFGTAKVMGSMTYAPTENSIRYGIFHRIVDWCRFILGRTQTKSGESGAQIWRANSGMVRVVFKQRSESPQISAILRKTCAKNAETQLKKSAREISHSAGRRATISYVIGGVYPLDKYHPYGIPVDSGIGTESWGRI